MEVKFQKIYEIGRRPNFTIFIHSPFKGLDVKNNAKFKNQNAKWKFKIKNDEREKVILHFKLKCQISYLKF